MDLGWKYFFHHFWGEIYLFQNSSLPPPPPGYLLVAPWCIVCATAWGIWSHYVRLLLCLECQYSCSLFCHTPKADLQWSVMQTANDDRSQMCSHVLVLTVGGLDPQTRPKVRMRARHVVHPGQCEVLRVLFWLKDFHIITRELELELSLDQAVIHLHNSHT